MSAAPVNRMLVFAFTSVAMLTGFVAVAVVAAPIRGDRAELPVVWSLLLLPVPSLFAAGGFRFVTQGTGGRRSLAALAVVVGGIGATIVGSGFGGLVLMLAPLATAAVAVLSTRLLGSV